MDVQTLAASLKVRLELINLRYSKLKPALKGRALQAFIDFQPLVNINPHDPDDPIPWRTDPDARFSNYELKLIAEQFANVNRKMLTPLPTRGKRDIEETAWQQLQRRPSYEPWAAWIIYCRNHKVIGTCTSRFKIEGQMQPPVKRGEKGYIIDATATAMLAEDKRRIFRNLDPNSLMVIFGDHMYFLDSKRLNKLKFDLQPSLF